MKRIHRTQPDNSRYTIHGYKDREEYLTTLAETQGIDLETVRMLADMLGDSEDFDGLVSELDEFAYIFDCY